MDALSEEALGGLSAERLHSPVMIEEVMAWLVTKKDGFYVDGTLGAGGHSERIFQALSSGGRLLGMDRDPEILEKARKRFQKWDLGGGPEYVIRHACFEEVREQVRKTSATQKADGILLDLGVSSFQLDQARRGFSFSKEAPLDMRMDPSPSGKSAGWQEETAAFLLQKSSQKNLEKILEEFGEEPFSRRIAAAVVEERRRHPLRTTTDLARLVERAVPRNAWPRHIHVATRTFQALRIAVNHELEQLDHFLGDVPEILAPGGRLAILSYHSLEDRRVKESFRAWEGAGIMKRLTKKPLRPSDEEISKNPRSRSARLRVAEKVAS